MRLKKQGRKRGTSPLLVTIDGPAGSGKSTVAKLLARRLRVMYLDTGATYRALANAAVGGVPPAWVHCRGALPPAQAAFRVKYLRPLSSCARTHDAQCPTPSTERGAVSILVSTATLW